MTEIEKKILTELEALELGDIAPEEEEVDEGWIKLHRKSLKSAVFSNCHLWHVWSYCMLRACHASVRFYMDGKVISLEPGQFVTGRRKMAKRLGMSDNMTYRLIHVLKDMGNIDIISNKRYSVITLLKWPHYQNGGGEYRPQVRPVLDQSQTSPRPVLDTYKNDKNDKNEKKKERGGTQTQRSGVASAPPSLSEILEYMKHINCPHPERNAEKFEAHYTAVGWKQNKGKPILDWKAACRGWKIRQEEYEAENPRKSETVQERAKRIARELQEGK